MKEIILVKYGEIILKGANRPRFENILVKNIRDAIKNIDEVKITVAQATIYIEPQNCENLDIICERLSTTPALVMETIPKILESLSHIISKFSQF